MRTKTNRVSKFRTEADRSTALLDDEFDDGEGTSETIAYFPAAHVRVIGHTGAVWTEPSHELEA